MTFKRAVWLPITLAIVAINLAGGIYAYLTNEPMHAFAHGAAAVTFGFLGALLLKRPASVPRQVEQPDKVQMLQSDLSDLERELHETQQRLDFAEELLKKKPPAS